MSDVFDCQQGPIFLNIDAWVIIFEHQPGTVDVYPNWRMPLADMRGKRISLEEIFMAPLPRRLAAVMNGLDEQPESRWDR